MPRQDRGRTQDNQDAWGRLACSARKPPIPVEYFRRRQAGETRQGSLGNSPPDPPAEVLFLVVCGTITDCDDYDDIAAWGDAHLDFLRQHLPFTHGVPGGRWLTILMNRISPELFQAAFTAWVRETWPGRPDFIAIDGKTSRRSHDRAAGEAPLHLVSAFATTSRLVLGQEAVADKSNELTAIPGCWHGWRKGTGCVARWSLSTRSPPMARSQAPYVSPAPTIYWP
jgi:hypothetical protein